MVLAALSIREWILVFATALSATAAMGGFIVQWRRDSSTASKVATSVAAEVTEAGLHSLNQALRRADDRALSAERRSEASEARSREAIDELRTEVNELRHAVERCEQEKAGLQTENLHLAERIEILEAAR